MFFSILVLFATINTALGMYPNPAGYSFTQPDGTLVEKVFTIGRPWDPIFRQEHDGYTVIKEERSGFLVYAQETGKGGKLAPSNLTVGIDDPVHHGLKKHLTEPNPLYKASMHSAHKYATKKIETTTMKNLVILLRFSDHRNRVVPSEADIDVLMNHDGPTSLAPTGSVKDVYLQNSHDRFELDSTVAQWVDLPNTEAYYADGNFGHTGRLWDALIYAMEYLQDNGVVFDDFRSPNSDFIDGITFLHSGYGAEWGGNNRNRIWSHQWTIWPNPWVSRDGVQVQLYHISPALWGTSGSSIGRIGVIAHELGHFFGLPDLYDATDSFGDGIIGNGIGHWCLMGNSWGVDGSQLYPPMLSAWSRIELGWANVINVNVDRTLTMNSQCDSVVVYKIDEGYPDGEYLLLENRQPCKFDILIGHGGLALFHIDEMADHTTEGDPWQEGWPENGFHYKVALLQADGQFHLERGLNAGNPGDMFADQSGSATSIGPDGTSNGDRFPDTRAYQGGNIINTGVTIKDIGQIAGTSSVTARVTFA